MNHILSLILLSSLFDILSASEREFKTAFLPLYVEHSVVGESIEDIEAVHANPRSVSFISVGPQPEATLSFIMSSYVPHHDPTMTKVGDANLISLSGITLACNSTKSDGEKPQLEIIVNISKFNLPDNINLKKEEVIKLIRSSIALNFPHATITIKDGEQAAPSNR